MFSRLPTAVGALFLASCVTPEKRELPFSLPSEFTDEAGGGQVEVPDRWWEAFDDAALTARIERALGANLELEVAWERVREAIALRRGQSLEAVPEVMGTLSSTYERAGQDRSEAYAFGLAAEYEVDLWGRLAAAEDAEIFRARAVQADYRAAAITLSGEVATVYFQIVEARSQRELLTAQMEANTKILESLRARLEGGLIRSADLLRQRQLVERTREQRIVIEARLGTLENVLAVLEGRPPQFREAVVEKHLPLLPAFPETGQPASLVQRRPDVRSAALAVRAADADLGVAIAERFPRLTLGAGLSTEAPSTSDLFDSWIRSLVGQLTGPVFDAGRRAAQVEAQGAVARQRLLEYGQVVLVAFREVEDAILLERSLQARLASLDSQVALVREAYDRLQTEYFNGVVEYLDVLTALIETQQLQRDRLEAQRLLLEARIQLYRALAGGFETGHEQPEPSQES